MLFRSNQKLRTSWNSDFKSWESGNAERATLLKRLRAGELPSGWDKELPNFPCDKEVATRKASGDTINAIAKTLPELFGGSADLAESNNTTIEGGGSFLPASSTMKDANPFGRTIHFGIREHAMASICNGMALHGLVKPFAGTFLVFKIGRAHV